MKTQKQNLNFNKYSVIELNDAELNDVNGGSTILITTGPCIVAASVVIIATAL